MGRISGRRSKASAGQNIVIVAQARSAEELRNLTPSISQIPDGVRGRVIIDGPFIGPLADLAFAEQTWGQRLAPSGARVTDVFGDGLNRAVIEYEIPAAGEAAQGFARAGLIIAVLVLLAAIAGAAIALGWAVRQITVLFFGDEPGGGVAGTSRALIGLGVIGGGLLLASSLSNRSRPGDRR
jgi:hypothetical protein